jgi:hypothetical protein
MNLDTLFSVANSLAALGWLALIVLPRRRWLFGALLGGVVACLSVLYAALMFLYFFRVEGGGFDSLAQVMALLASPPVALAGWVHYLAFDLAVGLWIAHRLDALAVSRWMQAPILVVTFQFGPLGLLAALIVMAVVKWAPAKASGVSA